MAMGIYHTGGSQLALAIYNFGSFEAGGNFTANIGNLLVFNSDILHNSIRSVQQFDIFNQYFTQNITPLALNRLSYLSASLTIILIPRLVGAWNNVPHKKCAWPRYLLHLAHKPCHCSSYK